MTVIFFTKCIVNDVLVENQVQKKKNIELVRYYNYLLNLYLKNINPLYYRKLVTQILWCN